AFFERELGRAHPVARALPGGARLGDLARLLVAVGGALERARVRVALGGGGEAADPLEQLGGVARLARLGPGDRRALEGAGGLVLLGGAAEHARLAPARFDQRVGGLDAEPRAREQPRRALEVAQPLLDPRRALELVAALEQLGRGPFVAQVEQRLARFAP